MQVISQSTVSEHRREMSPNLTLRILLLLTWSIFRCQEHRLYPSLPIAALPTLTICSPKSMECSFQVSYRLVRWRHRSQHQHYLDQKCRIYTQVWHRAEQKREYFSHLGNLSWNAATRLPYKWIRCSCYCASQRGSGNQKHNPNLTQQCSLQWYFSGFEIPSRERQRSNLFQPSLRSQKRVLREEQTPQRLLECVILHNYFFQWGLPLYFQGQRVSFLWRAVPPLEESIWVEGICG